MDSREYIARVDALMVRLTNWLATQDDWLVLMSADRRTRKTIAQEISKRVTRIPKQLPQPPEPVRQGLRRKSGIVIPGPGDTGFDEEAYNNPGNR